FPHSLIPDTVAPSPCRPSRSGRRRIPDFRNCSANVLAHTPARRQQWTFAANLISPATSPGRLAGRAVTTTIPRRRARLALQALEGRAVPALSSFELDGNAMTQSTHDWDQVYNDAVVNPSQNTSGSIPGAVVFVKDPTNSPTDNIFTGGQTT